MEAEMMREPWQFPREPASCSVAAPRRHHHQQQQLNNSLEDDAGAEVLVPNGGIGGGLVQPSASETLSNWEENFQDLSGWCMANARCDFHAGEPTMTSTELPGTINEGSVVLTGTSLTGVHGPMTQTIERKMNNPSTRVINANRSETATRGIPHQQHQQQQHHHHLDHAYPIMQAGLQSNSNNQQQPHHLYNNNLNVKDSSLLINESNAWMTTKIKPEVDITDNNNSGNSDNNNRSLWQELGDLGVCAAETGLPLSQQTINSKDTQDVFQTLEADTANFDLLSYLCEDDIPSPVDSVSTDSSRVTDASSLPQLPSNSSAHIIVSPRTYEPVTLGTHTTTDSLKIHTRLQVESPEIAKLSPISSTSSSEVNLPSRSNYRQLRNIVKIEKPDSPEPATTTLSSSLERRSMRTRRSRNDSTASSTTSTSRGRGRKRILQDDSDVSDDEIYRETREKNNEASRKSRMNKKAKEMEMERKAVELEKDNRILKMKVEELEKLVTSMRNALLRSALKREVKTNMF